MDPFRASLVAVAGLLANARDPWWLIGSGAATLHGAGGPPPADVDVLLSRADAERLGGRITPAIGDSDSARRFRSAVFGRWPAAPLPVELMAGLHLRVGDGWQPVALTTREPVAVAGATLWVPAHAELIALLHRFGRPKDRARAAILAALPPAPPLPRP